MKLFYNIAIRAFCLTAIFLISCKKLIDVDPPVTSINKDNVFKDDKTAAAVLTGVYSRISGAGFVDGSALTSLSFYTGLSSDELTLFSGTTNVNYSNFYTNSLTNTTIPNFWVNTYSDIYTLNSAIEGIGSAATLTPSIKKQLMGEALFMRAFDYFYLTNLYGDVPIITGIDYKINSLLSRSPSTEVYKFMIADLIQAKALLGESYLNADITTSSTNRVRPTKWAAIALLARVYLYTKDFQNADVQTTELIDNSSLFSLAPLNDVFLISSKEAIWQLQPVNFGRNTEDAWLFVIPSTGLSDDHPVYLSKELLNKVEASDNRRNSWIRSITDKDGVVYNFANKYKRATFNEPVTEYQMVFRLGEQYLIRAEARANLNNIDGALKDLNSIRNRAGLGNLTVNNKVALLQTIIDERQVELFTEWGHRWFDLKRTDLANHVMVDVTAEKGGNWKPNAQLYPITLKDLQLNPNLKQNSGY
jgi:hypothetical protein